MVTTAANHKHSDVWRRVWQVVDDFGRDALQLHKVRSHRSLRSVQDGSADMTFQDWTGNKAADAAAKKGAALHPMYPGLPAIIKDAAEETEVIAKWLGRLGAYLIDLKSPDVQPRAASHNRLELVEIPPVEERTVGWQPRILHCEAKNVRPLQQSPVEQAEQPMPARAAFQDAHASHRLQSCGAYLFCTLCGAHASKRRSRLLASHCRGPCRHVPTQLQRLLRGLHPVSGDPLRSQWF
eukprot:1569168-Karenia_brevis.AAC.1